MEDLKETKKSILKVFDKFHKHNESSEAEALELLSQLPNPAEVRYNNNATLLHHACYNGWYEVAKVLIEKYNCNPNRNDAGSAVYIPLCLACWSGNLDLVKYLILDKECDLNDVTNHKGQLPLHHAAFGGHLDVTKFLIEYCNVDSGIKDSSGLTPLHYSCKGDRVEDQQCNPASKNENGQKGHLNVAKYLIEDQKCSPSCKDNYSRTPLHLSCLNGYLDVARYLIEKQCDSSCRDNNGRTPLHLACEGGYLKIATYLIEEQACNPASENKNGQTPLHSACVMGHLHLAKYLIERHKCDPECTNYRGQTPLHFACRRGQLKVVKYLIEKHKCDPACTNYRGQTPLHFACQRGQLKVVKYLIEKHKCDPTCKNYDGQAPLQLAFKKGHLTVAKYLIEGQHIVIDQSIRENDNWTLLHSASMNGRLDVAIYLIEELHCDPACSDRAIGWTPLHLSCQEGHLEIVRYLIEKQQCNPACKRKDDQTPLHSACRSGHIHVVKYLIEKKQCDPACRKNDGQTPLHLACKGGHLNVAKYLIEEQHVNPAIKDNKKQLPLHVACCDGRHNVIAFLLNKCENDPMYKDSVGYSSFTTALMKNHLGIVNLIIRSRYKEEVQCGRTYLHLASIRGDLEIIKFIIEDQHCTPQIKDSEGMTPLHLASKHGHIDVVRYLVNTRNCSAVCKANDGSLPSSLAIVNNHSKIALFLLQTEYGVYENSLLIYSACRAGHTIGVQYLAKNFNPHIRDSNGFAPLHIACENGYLEIVKYLIQEANCDPMCMTSDAWTPLHSATQYGKLDVIKYLTSDQECDPSSRTLNGTTALHLACRYQHFDVVVYLVNECISDSFSSLPYYGNSLMEEALKGGSDDILFFLMSQGLQFTSYGQIDSHTRLVQPALKVFVLGNAMSGKSTLIKALLSNLEAGGWFSKIFSPKVTGVEPHTAGIIPYHAHSPSCGRLILYDFAGQHEHYSSSHAAVLERLRCAHSDLVFIVVDISRSKEQLAKELKYWDSFVSNQYEREKPPIIVIGSHFDVAKQQGKQTLSQALSDVPHDHLNTFITLDCTRKSSSGLTEICKQIQTFSKRHHEIFHVSVQVHFLNRLLREKFEDKIACQFYEILNLIGHEDNAALRRNSLLPFTTDSLSNQLSKLSEHGQFLYIENSEDIKQSWIILKKEVLLSELNGSIFAPKEFESVYKDLSSTGVVALSKVIEALPHYNHNIKMLMDFMITLDFCHEIDKSDLSIISNDQPIVDDQLYYFFPAMVSTDSPTETCQTIISKNYRFGWCLKCRINVFFTSRFLQVLLLRLAFTFALPEVSSTSEESSLKVERRKCNIWKNGIH